MSGNPWLDDNDSQPSKPRNRWLDDDDESEDFDPNKDYLTQTVQRKHNDMLESTQRSLRMLNESEDVGIATGQELVRQREVLERTEKKVDKINADLNESEYHMRSIKSLWGAFTNKFRKLPEPTPAVANNEPPAESTSKPTPFQFSEAQQQSKSYDNHPVLQRQDENNEMYSQPEQQTRQKNSVEQQIDNNLDDMGSALGRLKNLGLGLQTEIDSSMPIISRLGDKVTRVDERTRNTNRELQRMNRS